MESVFFFFFFFFFSQDLASICIRLFSCFFFSGGRPDHRLSATFEHRMQQDSLGVVYRRLRRAVEIG